MNIQKIMHMLNPKKADNWVLMYKVFTEETIKTDVTEWQRTYHNLRPKDEYVMIYEWDSKALLYVVNVSAESVMYALSNVMKLLADKF